MNEFEIICIKFLIILIRVIAALANFPVMANRYLRKKEVVVFSCILTLSIYSLVEKNIQIEDNHPFMISLYIIIEILIGTIISISSKIFTYIIYVVDHFISIQSSLGIASTFDHTQKINISVFSNFFILNVIVAIFAFDIDHIFIISLVKSYQKFSFGIIQNLEDFTKFFILTLSESFKLVFNISAPFILINIFSLSANSILSRLMPNLQIFFIIAPAQILLLILILFFVINNSIYKIVEKIKFTFF